MTVAVKSLADGQLPVSIGDLYTCPASTQAIIKTIKIVNTNTTAEAVNIYVLKASSTARRIAPKAFSLAAAYMMVLDDEVTLEAGDKIQGDSTTAAKCDFTIFGVEEA